nr:hypothetical protein CFP56_26104 [Quercus suber]
MNEVVDSDRPLPGSTCGSQTTGSALQSRRFISRTRKDTVSSELARLVLQSVSDTDQSVSHRETSPRSSSGCRGFAQRKGVLRKDPYCFQACQGLGNRYLSCIGSEITCLYLVASRRVKSYISFSSRRNCE